MVLLAFRFLGFVLYGCERVIADKPWSILTSVEVDMITLCLRREGGEVISIVSVVEQERSRLIVNW